MPVHLDSVSRRRFLRDAAVLTLAPAVPSLAADAGGETHWALLADTHIAENPEERSPQDVCMAENLDQVVAELLEEASSLSGVIIDGDCAYIDGQPGDYQTLTNILAPLAEAGTPVHFTLGNHDDRVSFHEVCRDRAERSALESKHCTILETPAADWILLDTLRYVDQVEGELGEDQLDWLRERLRQDPAKPKLVVGHHYASVHRTDVIEADEEIPIAGLVDSEGLRTVLEDAPAARAYIFGHSHLWGLEEENGVHHVNLPPTAYVFRPGQPNGWVRATLNDSECRLELRCLDRDHPKHGEVHKLEW